MVDVGLEAARDAAGADEHVGVVRAGARGRPRLVAQRAQPHRPVVPGQRVVARQGQQELVRLQLVAMQLREVRSRRVLVLLRDRDVDAAARQQRQRLLGLELGQLDPQRRMLRRKPLERRHHQRPRRGLERRDAHDAADLARLPRQVRLQLLEPGQHAAGAGRQHPPGVGQLEPPARLAEQLDARLALELGELLGDRRRREGERLGGARDRPLGDELAQHEQTAGREHR